MKRFTKQFAFCLDNEGTEPSLVVGKVYPIERDSRVRRKLLALRRAG